MSKCDNTKRFVIHANIKIFPYTRGIVPSLPKATKESSNFRAKALCREVSGLITINFTTKGLRSKRLIFPYRFR